ncbi:MAG: FtsL-like putative cell division protein [Alistipes sp.]|nr:FtsL-like putative cell division protein [Alistipes sp.]
MKTDASQDPIFHTPQDILTSPDPQEEGAEESLAERGEGKVPETETNTPERKTPLPSDTAFDPPSEVESTQQATAPLTTEQARKHRHRSQFERQVRQILSGTILTREEVSRHYPYVLFMTLLMFLYIANGYYIQKLHRQSNRLTQQVKELRAQSMTITSQRMIATRQSELLKTLQERQIPLEELVVPPKVIDQ